MLYIPTFAEEHVSNPTTPHHHTTTTAATATNSHQQQHTNTQVRPSSAVSVASTPTAGAHTHVQFENYTVSSFLSLEFQQLQDKDPDMAVMSLLIDMSNRLAGMDQSPTAHQQQQQPPPPPRSNAQPLGTVTNSTTNATVTFPSRRSLDCTTSAIQHMDYIARQRNVDAQTMEWGVLGPELMVRGLSAPTTAGTAIVTPMRPRSGRRQSQTQVHGVVPPTATTASSSSTASHQPPPLASGLRPRSAVAAASLAHSRYSLCVSGHAVPPPTCSFQIVAAHGGVEEEILAEDGVLEEYFASTDGVDFSVDNPDQGGCSSAQTWALGGKKRPDPFASYSFSVCSDTTRRVHSKMDANAAARNRRREELGFPSVSPKSCFREDLASAVFYSVWDIVGRTTEAISGSATEVEERDRRNRAKKHKVKRRKKKSERLDEYLQEQQGRYTVGVHISTHPRSADLTARGSPPPPTSMTPALTSLPSTTALPPIDLSRNNTVNTTGEVSQPPSAERRSTAGVTTMNDVVTSLSTLSSVGANTTAELLPFLDRPDVAISVTGRPVRAHTAMPSSIAARRKQVLSLATYMQ
eukprot:PhM_4_TR17493/c0_g1_i2/m.44216